MGFREFLAVIAGTMMTNALVVDSMLPALPEIGDALGMTVDNQRQWIVTSYMLGFGAEQGIGAAGTPVRTVSIVRDCYSRRKMSQVISLRSSSS